MIAALWIAALAPASLAGTAAGSASPDIDLRLIAFNDFHGYLDPPQGGIAAPGALGGASMLSVGGAAYLTALVRQLEAGHPRRLVVAAGDLVGASPFASALFHDEPAIAALNALGLQLSAVGNHEFDHGAAELKRLQHGGCAPAGKRGVDTCIGGDFPGARFAYLAANVIERSTGKPLFPAWRIEEIPLSTGRPLRIAFIGEVLREAAHLVMPSGVAGLEFRDEAATANALVPELRARGADAIVLLIHQGGATSGFFDDHGCPDFFGAIVPILAALDPAIRVVVSGHTHEAYVCERGGRLVTSAGSYGRLVTAIDLGFDAHSHALVAMHADNRPVLNDRHPAPAGYTPLAPAADVAALLEPYARLAAPRAGRVVGRIAGDLTRRPNAAGESALGDVIADSLLAAARADGALIAFTNPGGLRDDLLRANARGDGAISFAQLAAVLPFGNTVVTMDLSGAQLLEALRRQRFGRPLQVSQGFMYAWADGRVDADSLKIAGQPVEAGQTYRIAVNSFLADGGDGYQIFKRGQRLRTLGGDLDAALAWFAAHSPVPPGVQNRIGCEDCGAVLP